MVVLQVYHLTRLLTVVEMVVLEVDKPMVRVLLVKELLIKVMMVVQVLIPSGVFHLVVEEVLVLLEEVVLVVILEMVVLVLHQQSQVHL